MKHTAAALLLAAAPALANAEDYDAAFRPFLDDCARAGEALWGQSLCARIVLVGDAEHVALWTSEAPPKGLPAVRANTAVEWDGRTWLMLLAPLPADDADRRALVFHEAFHVHQRALGLPPNTTAAAHLDTAAARTSLRLEWNALAQALQSTGDARHAHVRQALAFRAMRLSPDAAFATAEREQMRHEGLAAYTGTALSGAPVRIALRSEEHTS